MVFSRNETDIKSTLADYALQMKQIVVKMDVAKAKHIQLLIEIDCGPIVAEEIGRRKYSWDIWGDTVNVASRMMY